MSLVFGGEKVALVTGGAHGIGAATALKLAENGCHVIINYYNSSDDAQILIEKIQSLGQKAIAIQANVADRQSVAQMLTQIRQVFGRLDFLVSNAASGVLRPAIEMSTKHWRWCMETNALALNHLVAEARDLMSFGSRVIALSSLGSQRAIPNYAFVGASKAALESLVRSLSLELAEDGICVNTVSAGVIDTNALKHFPNRESLLKEYQEKSLADRPLSPKDVADTIYLLCLPEAQMIKGQVIFVDAGYSSVG